MTTIRTAFFSLVTTFCLCAFGQIKDSVIVYHFYKFSNDKEVKVKLKTGQSLSIRLKDSIDDSKYILSSEEYFEGYFSKIIDNSLIIKCWDHGKTLYYKDSVLQAYTFAKKQPPFIATVDLDRIYYFECVRKSSVVFNTISLLSSITALVIAPAVSYNYSSGSFNSDRYLSILKPSVIGTALGFTIGLSLSSKKFKIRPTRL